MKVQNRILRYICAALFLASAAGSPAATKHSNLLPESFGDWTASGPATSTITGLPGIPGSPEEQAALMKEAGVTSAENRNYAKGQRQISVSLRQMRDSSSAYELYTFGLRPGMSKWTAGQLGAANRASADILIGNIVVVVSGAENTSAGEVGELASMLKSRADKTPLPPIPNYLPEDDGVSGTERYALGPVAFRAAAKAAGREEFAGLASSVGFSSGAEAMFAGFTNGRDNAVLLLIVYPTPQLAELHLRHLESALPPGAKQSGTSIERKASLLTITLKSTSADYAQALRNLVNYETQVTWNEASQTATDPSWGVLIVRIFIGTGVFMIAAVVVGIAFGGLRVLTKIFLPGKVFDRPERMEVIQLGLSGKTINSRDFY
jgi:hypothetical protein